MLDALFTPPMLLTALFVYFLLLIVTKQIIQRNGWDDIFLVKAAWYVFALRFLFLDVVANYILFSPMVLHFTWEEKTITAHANFILKNARLFTRWQVGVSAFICRALNFVDPGHCSALR